MSQHDTNIPIFVEPETHRATVTEAIQIAVDIGESLPGRSPATARSLGAVVRKLLDETSSKIVRIRDSVLAQDD